MLVGSFVQARYPDKPGLEESIKNATNGIFYMYNPNHVAESTAQYTQFVIPAGSYASLDDLATDGIQVALRAHPTSPRNGSTLWRMPGAQTPRVAALRSVAAEKVPAGHGVEEMEPAGQ